jgi:polyketide biosynthesis enoyl-CoA hydratase PksH
MEFTTLRVGPPGTLRTITLARPESQNAINAAMLRELNAALDVAEQDQSCHVVVLEGADGVFCDGMDFEDTTGGADAFMDLMRRLASSSRIVAASVDGRVTGGGVGLAAACDLVVATPRSQFSLPEVLWGLIPACVLPYLIRRIGFQRAYRMALTTQPVTAAMACDWALVDEVGDSPKESLRRLLLRAAQIHPETIGVLKRYARELHAIDGETERRAVAELTRLLGTERVQTTVAAFLARRQAAEKARP